MNRIATGLVVLRKDNLLQTQRPVLTKELCAEEFRAWYWLKEELVVFCRAQGLSSVGLKPQIEARISDYLSGSGRTRPSPQPRRAGIMPREFARDTLIGEGWRCNPALGAFFQGMLGRGFRFNKPMRTFIHMGAGRTLGDAARAYQESVLPGAPKTVILDQLEYNRHFRDYFRDPGTTREEAIAAWWTKRSRRQP